MEQTAHSRNTPTLAGPDSSGAMLKPSLGRQRHLPECVCVSVCGGVVSKRKNVRGLYGVKVSETVCACMNVSKRGA